MTPNLAIIIPAYNRPEPLKRLLWSISAADYPRDGTVTLIISLEGDANDSVMHAARDFAWKGQKEIVQHRQHIGLREHILWCGDQSAYFDGVIVLEDDLVVSPHFYSYATSVLEAYEGSPDEQRIASYSLYAFCVNEFALRPFVPLADGKDVFFLQTCSSWGQLWSARQWSQFRVWYGQNSEGLITEKDGVPAAVAAWPETSWKKYFNKYMAMESLYSVVPRFSLSTNFGDAGTHRRSHPSLFQVPLLIENRHWAFGRLEESVAVYDAYFEPSVTRLASQVRGIDTHSIECDLYGIKPSNFGSKQYRLSTRPFVGDAVAVFGNRMIPTLLNVLFEVPGHIISLGPSSGFMDQKPDSLTLLEREAAFIPDKDYFRLALDAVKNRMMRGS